MSRPQVTITLGRSGQVVKRAGPVSDTTHTDSLLSSGGKRSLRERLGSNSDNPLLYGNQSKNKRQRGDGNKWNPNNNGVNDSRVSRDDLRFKLLQKSSKGQPRRDNEGQNNVDLRQKLLRTVQTPMNVDRRQQKPEPKPGLLRRIPPTRSADDLFQMESLRKSYSAWTLDGLRCRSPDRVMGNSRGLSPPRNMNVLQQVPPFRSFDASRPPHMSKDVIPPRSAGSTTFMTKSRPLLEAPNSVQRLPPPSGIMQKASYVSEEHLSVSSLLHSLGLEKYSILFQAEEVDMSALKQMGDNDLKELGIPMGPRKKILLAVLPRPKRHL